jgi:hypothetical protein
MTLRAWASAAVLALTAMLTPGAAAPASASATAVPPCPGGSVCFFSGEGFGGSSWEWTAASGYRDMPPNLHDHVGSFVANTTSCFIDYAPAGRRTTNPGDWRTRYLDDFGGRIDAVQPGAC